MRPSEITAADLAVFARYCVDAEEYEKLARNEQSQVALALNAAKGYVRGYAGLDLDRCDRDYWNSFRNSTWWSNILRNDNRQKN